MASCCSYAIEGDPKSGPCRHPAGYQTAGDGVEDYCACHYPDGVYSPAECGDVDLSSMSPEEAWNSALGAAVSIADRSAFEDDGRTAPARIAALRRPT